MINFQSLCSVMLHGLIFCFSVLSCYVYIGKPSVVTCDSTSPLSLPRITASYTRFFVNEWPETNNEFDISSGVIFEELIAFFRALMVFAIFSASEQLLNLPAMKTMCCRVPKQLPASALPKSSLLGATTDPSARVSGASDELIKLFD